MEPNNKQQLDTSPIGIFITDAQGDRSYVNKKWCDLTGLSANEANHRCWIQAVHPDDRIRCKQEWNRALGYLSYYQSKHRYVRKGKDIWVLTQAFPICDHENNFIGYLGTVYDLVGQHYLNTSETFDNSMAITQYAKNLTLQQRSLPTLESSFESFYVLDLDCKILFVHDSICGSLPNEVVGNDFIDIIGYDHGEIVKNLMNILISSGENQSCSIPFVRDNNEQVWYSLRMSAIKNENNIIGISVTATDISDSMLQQSTKYLKHSSWEKQAKMYMLEELVSMIKHEICQPLTVINNYNEGLISRLDKGKLSKQDQADAHVIIQGQVKRVRDILDGFSFECSSKKTSKEYVDIHMVIDKSIEIATIGRKNNYINIIKNYCDKEAIMFCDPLEMKHVFINVTQNAIEAMDNILVDSYALEITTRFVGKKIHITFRDFGSGVVFEDISRIFEPFVTTKHSGYGMGLAICKKIISNHNGYLVVENHPKKGAIIEMVLPSEEEVL